jgi:hypothetical protein
VGRRSNHQPAAGRKEGADNGLDLDQRGGSVVDVPPAAYQLTLHFNVEVLDVLMMIVERLPPRLAFAHLVIADDADQHLSRRICGSVAVPESRCTAAIGIANR